MAHEEQDIAHGTQRGDPAKAANAIIAAVDADSHVRACCSANVALDTSRRLADRTGTSRRLTAGAMSDSYGLQLNGPFQ